MSTHDSQRDAARSAMFAEHRRYLFAVAYRMLGIAEDAEDIVQDAWLRFASADPEEIEHPRTYLVTIVSRLCIDSLRSARKRREEYVGVWLPEPIATDDALADGQLADIESASFAFLLMLDRLSPLQRAVLVLFDVLDYTHEEIAAALGGTVAASRQALRRARQRMADVSSSTTTSTPVVSAVVEKFITAARAGDVGRLMDALAPEVVLLTDGGGRAIAALNPIEGNDAVGRFFASIGPKGIGAQVSAVELNGQTALLVHEDGTLTTAFLFDGNDHRIGTVYAVRNPDKLARLVGLKS